MKNLNPVAELEKWLGSEKVDEATKSELLNVRNDENEVLSRFSCPMAFGTAGLRAVMKAGPACMNVYTVSHASAALSVLLKRSNDNPSIVIAYDSRNNSRAFSMATAEVFAYNGIKVYFFDSLRPTPMLSYAVVKLGCDAGVNITASHNTKEYNGYKAYQSDGAQLSVERSEVVSDEMNKLDIFSDVHRLPFDEGVKRGIITTDIVDSEGKAIDESYLETILGERINENVSREYGNSLNIIYTPLHGAGGVWVPEALKRSGITNLRVVESQRLPDGDFPTVKKPNPEEKACYDEAKLLDEADGGRSELILATDPDSDRMGVTVKDDKGDYITLSGNQIGVLLCSYIIEGRKTSGKLPANGCIIESLVSTRMIGKICADYGITSMDVLTGFKYIGEKIIKFSETKSNSFLLGFEESSGFLVGTHARDKDAVVASLMFSEAASFWKSKGMTVYEKLRELYEKYGYYSESTLSVSIRGAIPMDEMKKKMESLRKCPPAEIAGIKVESFEDFIGGAVPQRGCESGDKFPKADLLRFVLSDGTTVIIRPSGTEPTIKAYVLTFGKTEAEAHAKRERYSEYSKEILNK